MKEEEQNDQNSLTSCFRNMSHEVGELLVEELSELRKKMLDSLEDDEEEIG